MEIVPAILTDSIDELYTMINIAKGFTEYVQLDLMDGKFVPSKSVSFDELMGVEAPLGIDAHLMVNDPDRYLASL